VTQRSHRQITSDDPARWSEPTGTTPTRAWADTRRDPPKQDTVRWKRTAHERQVHRLEGQRTGNLGGSREARKGGLGSRRSDRTPSPGVRQRTDTPLHQPNPQSPRHGGADGQSGTCSVVENPHGCIGSADSQDRSTDSQDSWLAAYVGKIVDSAPPLTDAQRNRIAGILQAAQPASRRLTAIVREATSESLR
jgi:hypothetical protein